MIEGKSDQKEGIIKDLILTFASKYMLPFASSERCVRSICTMLSCWRVWTQRNMVFASWAKTVAEWILALRKLIDTWRVLLDLACQWLSIQGGSLHPDNHSFVEQRLYVSIIPTTSDGHLDEHVDESPWHNHEFNPVIPDARWAVTTDGLYFLSIFWTAERYSYCPSSKSMASKTLELQQIDFGFLLI